MGDADGLHHAQPKATIIENHDGLMMIITMDISLSDVLALWRVDPDRAYSADDCQSKVSARFGASQMGLKLDA